MAKKTNPEQGNSTVVEKHRRFFRWKCILGSLVVVQVVVVLILHSSHIRSISSMTTSLMIAENLQGFSVPVQEKQGTERSVETKNVTGLSEHTVDSAYTGMYSTGSMSSTTNKLWEKNTILPDWMKDYFQWHGEQMARLDKTTWKTMRFLVMQCLKTDSRCGGTADRLKPVPTMILLANETRRVLLIRWQRPCKLQEFLMPPRGGMDWRVPDWLEPQLPQKPFAGSLKPITNLARSQRAVAMARYQSYNAGAPYFDEQNNGTTFEGVYHDVWNILFTPVPPIAKMISESMQDMGLVPGQYASAHLRALYARESRDPSDTEKWATNAVNCASQLSPGSTIYFASDSSDAVSSIKKYATKKSRRIVALQDDESPLHLEKATNWTTRHPSEYYPTFRDLYILGFSHCVAYNVGGYGHWGLMLSDDSSCGNRYVTGNRNSMIACDWAEGEPTSLSSAVSPQLPLEPPIDFSVEMALTDASDNDKKETAVLDNVSNHTGSSTLPPWLDEYFKWHAEQRNELSESNWESKRFLVMQCALEDDKCGGTADRLKPLPSLLYLAHRSKRILLIWWTRPCKLEEFLVPPEGGLDWRVPSWLEPKLANTRKMWSILRIDRFIDGDDVIFRTRVQLNDGGASFYAEKTNGTLYDDFYHDMFRTVFAPSPPLAKTISETMKRLGLKSGEYAAAHLRALYAREHRPPEETAKLAINAVNCASQLRPGGPIYFAADSKHAVESVQKYAADKDRPIVTLVHDDEPLHLEKAENATSRHPSEYFATFVDLYLLGESRCLSYSNGGFGTWGLLMGYNASCSSRHFRGRHMMPCEWADALPAR